MRAEKNYGFPPTYKLMLRTLMPSGKLKVLDLGCGMGAAGEFLNPKKNHEFIGIDIYEPYLKICKKKGNYRKIIRADITKFEIQKKSFDVVLLLQVIEHLDKKAGENLIRKATKAAKKCVIVSVPNGYCSQKKYDGSIYHKHTSTWIASDLRQLDFKVYGQGLKIIYGSRSYGGGKNAIWWQKIAVPLAALLLPFIIIYPRIAAQLIGVKYLDEKFP